MYLAYSLLALVVFIVVSPYFLYQAIRHKKYIGSLRQRLGFLPITFNIDAEESIWIHAVSVGEALTARALAADLKARYPRLRLFLSTTTIAGQQVARHSLSNVDAIFYIPFDWTFIVRRTLHLVRPRLFVMMETEIWPNLLHECRRRGVKTVMINGRISARSYRRYRMVRPFFRRVLADVDRFCVQSEESARRFVELGADPAHVTVTGSLKFDSLELSPATPDSSRYGVRSCRSTRSRGPTSSCSTRLESWRSCINWPPRCLSAAAWWTTAATTSSSRRSSASRLCSDRTCRISRRSPTRFSPTAPRFRCSRIASWTRCS